MYVKCVFIILSQCSHITFYCLSFALVHQKADILVFCSLRLAVNRANSVDSCNPK